jgi:hypothetical protein
MKTGVIVCAVALFSIGCSEALPVAAPETPQQQAPQQQANAMPCGAEWEGHATPCPLQQWMRERVGVTMSDGDLKLVAEALERTATLSPDPDWGWQRIASEGAAAAHESNELRVRAACRACHEQYRPLYKAQYRLRPLATSHTGAFALSSER